MAEAAARLDAAIPGAFAGDAQALLVAVYKDPRHPIELRLEAAKAAIRFEKPVLAAVEVRADADVTIRTVSDTPLTVEKWTAEIAGRKH